jgi:alanyl-tRNA synthetase
MLKIISESAVAAGVRRIEATTGAHVEALIDNLESQLKMAKEIFGNSPDVLNSIKKMMNENDLFRKQMDEVARERIASLKKTIIEDSKVINGIRIFTARGVLRPEIIKDVAFELYREFNGAMLASAYQTHDNKACLVLMYTEDLVKEGADASKDIKAAAKLINGGGGGQNFLATAGGKNINGLSEALQLMIDTATKG